MLRSDRKTTDVRATEKALLTLSSRAQNVNKSAVAESTKNKLEIE